MNLLKIEHHLEIIVLAIEICDKKPEGKYIGWLITTTFENSDKLFINNDIPVLITIIIFIF